MRRRWATCADEFSEGWLVDTADDDGDLAKLRKSTRSDYRALITNDILPALRNVKVAEVKHVEIEGLHRKKSTDAPYRANRMLALLSRLFNMAIKHGYRPDNPAKGVQKNREVKRRVYVQGDALQRLGAALAEYPDQEAANIFRLLLLTGARRGEVLGMRWADLYLETGVWTKPGTPRSSAPSIPCR